MTALPVAMPAAPGEGDRRSRGSDFDRTLERAMQRTRRDRPDTPSRTSGRPDADHRPERTEDRAQEPATRAAESTDAEDDSIEQQSGEQQSGLQHADDQHTDDRVSPLTVDAVPGEPAPTATDPTPESGSIQDAAADAGHELAEVDGASTTDVATETAAPVTATGSTLDAAAAGAAGDTAAPAAGPAGADAGTALAATAGPRTASSTATSGDVATSVDASVAPASIEATTTDADAVPAARPTGPSATTAATVSGEADGTSSAQSVPNAATPPAVTPSAVQSVVTPPTQAPVAAPAPTTGPAAAAAEPTAEQRGVELGDLGSRLGASLRRNEQTQTLTIQLHPAELGAITVEARLVDGVTHLHLAPESASTTERLASSMADLRHQLARAGVDLGDLDLGERRDRSAGDATSDPTRRRDDGTAPRAPGATERPPIHHRGGLVAIDL